MLKKKIIAVCLVLVMVLSMVSQMVPMEVIAKEETNLNLKEEELRSIEMVAGDSIHQIGRAHV